MPVTILTASNAPAAPGEAEAIRRELDDSLRNPTPAGASNRDAALIMRYRRVAPAAFAAWVRELEDSLPDDEED